ncbi:MAG: PP2C family protein-serine/threonine phosphatase [Bacteroidia bacterium]
MRSKLLRKSNSRKIKDQKLNVLLEVTKAINNNQPTQELLHQYEHFLRNELNIEKIVLFSNDNEEWHALLSYGITEKEIKAIDIKTTLLPLKEITTVMSLNNKSLKGFDVVVPVYHKSHPLAYVLIGDIYEDELALSPTIKHLPFIQTLTNIIVVAIENKRLAKERLKEEVVRKELELASRMQAMLFPETLPNNENVEMAALYKPHQKVGGDYYDVITLNDNEIVLCMADVSGKGISAALLMSNFQANLRALLSYSKSLSELVRELNHKVMHSAKGEKFITLFIAKYNYITHTLNYVNAGHNPPLLASGNSINQLKVGSTGLGMFDDLPKVREGIITIEPYSVLVCYTDGIVDIENKEQKEFSLERMIEILKYNKHLSMTELNNLYIKKIDDFRKEMPYVDDITLLSCRFK